MKKLLLITLSALFFAGCNKQQAVTPPESVPVPRSQADSSVQPSTAAGHQFSTVVYIRKLYTRGGQHRIEVGTASAATASSAQSGSVTAADTTTKTYALAKATDFYMQTRNPAKPVANEQISYAVFSSAMNGEGKNILDRYTTVSFGLELNDKGEVTAIREQPHS
ncbi:MAG: hypothetical protein JWM56_743 [Candidatus Peribacteria bacterium]|nr:hypothetical protein [Candidatus Peribacteria bacterium]